MPDIRDLRRAIDRYIRGQDRPKGTKPLTMADVYHSARECQRRVEAQGFRWDPERLLWRHPDSLTEDE